MACPGGCVSGGGQPKSADPDVVLKRAGAVYALDQSSKLRKSHDNAEVQALYAEYLGNPNGPLAHQLLHTRYADRSDATQPAYTAFERADEQAAQAARLARHTA